MMARDVPGAWEVVEVEDVVETPRCGVCEDLMGAVAVECEPRIKGGIRAGRVVCRGIAPRFMLTLAMAAKVVPTTAAATRACTRRSPTLRRPVVARSGAVQSHCCSLG